MGLRGMEVMEDYLRPLCQQFVSNTCQPFLEKTPISFSRRGMGTRS